MKLNLGLANAIVDETLDEARRKNAKHVAVMVLDEGGHPIVYKREDGASLFRFDLARAKAMGALGMGVDTREITRRAQNNPTFFNTLAVAAQGNIVFSPGGVLIRDESGDIIGAIGVSGDKGDLDEECAFKGISAAGLYYEVQAK